MDGELSTCEGIDCKVSCCSRGHGENLDNFLKSPRFQLKSVLLDIGVTFQEKDSMMWIKNCGDSSGCKLLNHFGDLGDIRDIVCKIFPYKHVTITGGGIPENTIGIYLSSCPATQPNSSVPESFTNDVIFQIKQYYLKYSGKEVNVVIIPKFQEC